MAADERRLSIGQRVRAAAIASIATPLLGALARTLSWTVDGVEHYDAVIRSGKQPILAFWHGRILPGLFYFRDRRIVVITSQNFDGEWIARIIMRFGYGTARGSTSRGGPRALAQMRRDLAAGKAVAFTVDGPRGPARVAQAGAIWLAGATGHPVLPFHVEADRFWTTKSWDRGQIPKPFAKMRLAIGAPLTVSGTSKEEVERGRQSLEQSLRALESRAATGVKSGSDPALTVL